MNVNLQPSHCDCYTGLFKDYTPLKSVCDEFFNPSMEHLPALRTVLRCFDQMPKFKLLELQQRAQELFKRHGVTFNVYKDSEGQEKIFPFDLIPRVVDHREWDMIARGLEQRVRALNLFLADVYDQQLILKDGLLPQETVSSSQGFLPQLIGITPPGGIYIHVAGIDLIREDAHFMVLEDNLKVPSGVSYVLENRHMSKRLLPNIFSQIPIKAIDDYPLRLRHALHSLVAATGREQPLLVLLTPGPYNAAYFEHAYLAYRMGCALVQNHDLFVDDDKLFLKTHQGVKQVDILYRRIDDEFLDPKVFNPSSLLGVPGLMQAYRTGNVILANAPGNGVADDKGIYPYVPDIIRYYLAEDPILPQVETFSCMIQKQREYVLKHLSSLVIKVVNKSGGDGIIIGSQASKEQLSKVSEQIIANPRSFIAQPLIQLSTCPTLNEENITPRRVDLRPFIISGKSTWVLPGGLTRVALVKDSYIVNSSQGGGSKDTWVLGPS